MADAPQNGNGRKKKPARPLGLQKTGAESTPEPTGPELAAPPPEPESQEPPPPPPGMGETRTRKRRNVVGRSPNREEYVRLMQAGWSSSSLESYAWHRYGEDIPASTFRTYRVRSKIQPLTSVFGDIGKPEDRVDLVALRSDLVRLQTERIKIDFKHEESMQKLFSQNRSEIDLLSRLLDAHRADLQALGLFPNGASVVEHRLGQTPDQTPKHRSLSELVPEASEEHRRELARVLHLVTPETEAG